MTYPEQDLEGKRVTVLGLGVEGVELVRYLARAGALVTVSDARPAGELQRALAALADVPGVTYNLGENRVEDAVSADMLFVSPGVPRKNPALGAAREAGVYVTSLTRLFLRLCPGRIVGITGSSGKTTTTTLVGEIIARSGARSVTGGNLGRPLINLLDEIDEDTLVVLEVSHSQLSLTDVSPQVACITNVTPNHLDEFSWAEYQELKRNVLRHQKADDVAVLNADDPIVRSFAGNTPARRIWFSMTANVPGDGAYLKGNKVVYREHGHEEAVLDASDVPLRGLHNLNNVITAVAICRSLGIPAGVIRETVRGFPGVGHRLELVGTVAGASYYNDSIATTPERTVAGLRSFQERVVLLLGGRDKHLPLDGLVQEARARCRAVVFFGESGQKLLDAFQADERATGRGPRLVQVGTLPEAVEFARNLARKGDVVLLSPACTSFDAYRMFEERGEHFRAMVRALPGFKEVSP